jgi:hypothetical protein
MAEPAPKAYTVGFFTDPQAFLAACQAARDAAMQGVVAYAPWPVHGLEAANGHPRSWIGRAVLTAILLAAAGCLHFFVQSSVIEWPIIVSGKPFFSPEFWVVPVLETGLLAGAVVNLLACFHACKLQPLDHAVVDPRITDDQFALVVPVSERHTHESVTRWLEGRRAERVEQRGGA